MASGKESRDEFVEDNDARPDASRDDDARPSRYQTFYQPLTAEEYDDARYQPEDVSFFSRSSEDRAEKARRAAHRVRRREPDVTNATPEPSVPPRPQPQVQSPVPPTQPQPASEPQAARTANAPQSVTREPVAVPRAAASPVQAPPVAKPAPQKESLLDRAVQAPLAKVSPQQPPTVPPQADLGSLMDRTAARSESAKQKSPPPDVPLMDRLVDNSISNPVQHSAKPAEAEKRPAEKPSLMDRALQKPSPTTKAAKAAEAFEPKAVLSAPPKPASRGKPKRYKLKSSKTSPQSVADETSPEQTSALVQKAADAVPLSKRMKQLVKSKTAVEVAAKKPEPQPEPTRALTAEEAAFAGPSIEAELRKPDAVGAVAPVTPVPVAPAPVVSPEIPAPDPIAPESIYADQAILAPVSRLPSLRTKPFAAFEWMIAGRYLGARKREGFVSVIAGFSLVGIALGVATLIVVMAVMTGFRETLVTQIIGGSPHINVYSQSDKFENYDTLADQIRTVDGVVNVTPVVQGQVLGTGNQRHSGVIVRGMRKGDLEQLIANAEPEVLNGSLSDFVEDKGVALGADLAAKLGLRVGDFISLISPDGDITPFQATPMPRVKDYRIIQTFKLGVQEIDYGVAFMPFEEAQIYFNKQGQADTLDVFVDDPQSVTANLGRINPGSYEDEIFQSARSSVSVNNWKNLNGRLIGAINLERQVMFVILTMIILVAALNIISGLVMLVKDKARDVAIMRTMGMARGSILRIFFVCGSSIGVIGSILGVVLGVLFVVNIHAIQGVVEWVTGTQVWDPSVRAGITEIPTKLQLSDVALTLFIALGLSFIATLFPAWKAAKLDPVEALRYE